ncbi:MAG: site-2 protease family protein, partial [Firmicutes bacterium]|nr:site-2 protease family protein [Bacillota bacterium]
MTVIYAVLMFCVLIFIHELGHFIAAKKCGVKVNQFALGMGPAIFKKQKGETEYSLRIFPIGGFCAMEGEDTESEDSRAYNNKKPWQKALIAFAGPAMNVVLALVLMCIIMFVMGTASTKIDSFVDGSPAQAAGMKAGDEIVKINDVKISEWNDVGEALEGAKTGDKVSIVYKRDGKENTINTELMESEGRAMIGITPKLERHVGNALVSGAKTTFNLTTQMYTVIKQLFTGEVSTKELSGPVGIVYMVNQSASMGLFYFFYLLAVRSLNLAIVTLLPRPALDGGRIL